MFRKIHRTLKTHCHAAFKNSQKLMNEHLGINCPSQFCIPHVS